MVDWHRGEHNGGMDDDRKHLPSHRSDRHQHDVVGRGREECGRTAAQSLRDLRVGEIVKLDLTIEDGKVAHYRARVNISFKYQHD